MSEDVCGVRIASHNHRSFHDSHVEAREQANALLRADPECDARVDDVSYQTVSVWRVSWRGICQNPRLFGGPCGHHNRLVYYGPPRPRPTPRTFAWNPVTVDDVLRLNVRDMIRHRQVCSALVALDEK